MAADIKRFSGSIPENYHRYMVPLLFEPYSKELVGRVNHLQEGPVLEIACGTGSLTRLLRQHLPDDIQIVATDISSEMLELAQRELGHMSGLKLQAADAMDLPFPSASFEAVICQFGIMFLSDKRKGLTEMLRVLKPGGKAYVSTWADIAQNEFIHVANDAIQSLDLKEPISFTGGCKYSNADEIKADFDASGFRNVDLSVVTKRSEAASVESAVDSIIHGTTLASKLDVQGLLEIGRQAMCDKYRSAFGDDAVSGEMKAFLCEAMKPQ